MKKGIHANVRRIVKEIKEIRASKAKVCWDAVKNLKAVGLLLSGNHERVARKLSGVRFKNKKARYIVEARGIDLSELSRFSGVYDMRDWLK